MRRIWHWIKLQVFQESKSTENLHIQLLQMLKEIGLGLEDITNLITAAGPGSYTGMRVSEGIAQIFNWQGFKTYSFYHFQVPQLLEKENYVFMCKAFKGEFFLKDPYKEELLSLSDLPRVVAEYKERGFELLSHYPDKDFLNFSFTSDIISKQSVALFTQVLIENMLQGPFYFRPLEKEFKVTNA